MREVPDSNGMYLIDKRGNVFSKYINRYKKPSVDRDGYLLYSFSTKFFKKTWKAHRLVMFVYVGPSDLQVNHIDGNKKNNSLHNLEYCTNKENRKHAVENGLSFKKFDDDEVLYLRKIGQKLQEIADNIGGSRSIVKKILRENNVPKKRVKYPIEVFKGKKSVGIFPSATEAANFIGVDTSNVIRHINGEYKQTGGYTAKRIR